jgi:uncharacterized membrane protein
VKERDTQKKPLKRKENKAESCKKRPIKKPEPKLPASERLKVTGKAVGGVTVDLIKTPGEMAMHPKKSAYVIVTSSGEVVGEVTDGMLKGGGVVLKKTKNGAVLVKDSAERISGAEEAKTTKGYYLSLIKFFGPLVLLLVVYASYFIFFPPLKALTLLGTAAAYMFMIPPGVDKSTLILSANLYNMNPYQMAFNLWIIDSLLGSFLCLNFDYAKKIPLVGKRIATFEDIGRRTLTKHSWLKRFTLLGLFLFVVIPFQGSGALAGSIVGRIIGMKSWRVLIAVIGGTFTSVMLLAYSADLLAKYFPLWVRILVPVTIFVLIVTAMIYSYAKKKRKENDLHYQLYEKPLEEANEDDCLEED